MNGDKNVKNLISAILGPGRDQEGIHLGEGGFQPTAKGLSKNVNYFMANYPDFHVSLDKINCPVDVTFQH